MASNKSTQELSSLRSLDCSSVSEAVANSSGLKRNSYQKWNDRKQFQIGKYAAENDPAAVARKFTTQQNPLNESTVRRFCNLYKRELQQASKEKREIKSALKCLLQGRSILLDSLDEMVQQYLLATRSKRGLISSIIAIATAKVLIARYPEYDHEHIDLDSSWAKSLFKRMGFVKRMPTTEKVEIPEEAKNEAQFAYLHDSYDC